MRYSISVDQFFYVHKLTCLYYGAQTSDFGRPVPEHLAVTDRFASGRRVELEERPTHAEPAGVRVQVVRVLRRGHLIVLMDLSDLRRGDVQLPMRCRMLEHQAMPVSAKLSHAITYLILELHLKRRSHVRVLLDYILRVGVRSPPAVRNVDTKRGFLFPFEVDDSGRSAVLGPKSGCNGLWKALDVH